jgi:CheY-like chemotaxis protein
MSEVRPWFNRDGLAGIRVLAAEDNEVNREVLREMLELQGAEIVCVDNGRELLDRLLADGPERYDLVITDIQMPELDGHSAARRIRELAPQLPIIGLTAYARSQDRERSLASGMTEHLSKPVDLKELTAAILRCVGLGGALPPQPAKTDAESTGLEQAGLIDWPELVKRFAGNEQLVTRLASTLLLSHADTPARLRELAETGRWPELATLAHNLKGMAANLLADSVGKTASALNRAATQGYSESRQLALQLAEQLSLLLAEADQHLSRDGES